MNTLSSVKGVLFDLDGVLYIGAHAVDGAVEAVSRIQASSIQCRFVTNTSTLSLKSLQQKINTLGKREALCNCGYLGLINFLP